MVTVNQTEEFKSWLSSLGDIRARAKVLSRIERLSMGNAGDVAAVGEGVSEMRIHYGPGYRVYFVQRGKELAIILGGGDKSTQVKDIEAAKKLAKEVGD